MSWNINKVFLIGRLCNDIEIKYVSSGTAVAKFCIAVGKKPGLDGITASFFNVVVWGKVAENCNNFLAKGAKVAIDGTLDQRSWTAQDGSKRSTVEIIAARVEFLDTKNNNPKDNNDIPENNEYDENDIGVNF